MVEARYDGLKVLVTGAAGFIGYHLAQRILAAGATVTGLDNLNDYYDVNLKLARLRRLEGRNGFSAVGDRTGVLSGRLKCFAERQVDLAKRSGVDRP